MPHVRGDRGDSTLAAAVIAAGATVVAAVFGWFYPHWSEQTALISEAGYVCNAMSWQTFFITSRVTPELWQCADVDRVSEQCGVRGTASQIDPTHNPDSAWEKPLYPFRTPIWAKLKEKVGDLGGNADPLTGFFNRVEFLNVLAKKRDCFEKGDPRFRNAYLCTLSKLLNICERQGYGYQNCW